MEPKKFAATRFEITTRDGILGFRPRKIASGTPQPTVFLDRDGVVNRRIPGGYVTRWEEFVFLPEVIEALCKLRAAGLQLVIVSNQAGVGKGLLSCADLIQITLASLKELEAGGAPVDGAFFCLHAPSDGCACRKPNVGLLEEAARALRIDFGRSFLIGDSRSDMEVGERMGCTTIFVGDAADDCISATYRAKSIRDTVGAILARKS